MGQASIVCVECFLFLVEVSRAPVFIVDIPAESDLVSRTTPSSREGAQYALPVVTQKRVSIVWRDQRLDSVVAQLQYDLVECVQCVIIVFSDGGLKRRHRDGDPASLLALAFGLSIDPDPRHLCSIRGHLADVRILVRVREALQIVQVESHPILGVSATESKGSCWLRDGGQEGKGEGSLHLVVHKDRVGSCRLGLSVLWA